MNALQIPHGLALRRAHDSNDGNSGQFAVCDSSRWCLEKEMLIFSTCAEGSEHEPGGPAYAGTPGND
jgi:hypothetical protein